MFCSDQLSFTGQFCQTHWSHSHHDGLPQLSVVKMSWERNWSHGHNGHQVHMWAILASKWSKWAGKKILRKNLVFWQTSVFWSILSDTLVPWSLWSPGTHVGYLSFQWSKWTGKKILRNNLLFWPTFVFWSILSDTLVPWSPLSPSATQTTFSHKFSTRAWH